MPASTTQEEIWEAMAKAGISKKPGIYIAPILIGAAFDFVLLGVMWTQLWSYVMTSRRDKRLNRIIVGISTFVASATSIYTLAYVCHLFAFNFGTYLQFLSWKWLNWYALLDVVTTTTVNIFYTHKTYQLYKSRWIYVILTPFLLAALAGGVGSKVVAGSYLTDSTQAEDLQPYFFLWLGSVLVVGLLLTGLIMFKLLKAKNGDHMDRVLNRFVLLSVETQLPATLSAIAFMVSYAIEANSAMNIFFELFHPKIYVVGMLAVLNSRRAIRKILHPIDATSRKHTGGLESGLPPRFQQETLSMSTIHYGENSSALSLGIRYTPPANPQTSYTYGDGTEWTTSDGSTAIGSPVVAFPKVAVVYDKEDPRSR